MYNGMLYILLLLLKKTTIRKVNNKDVIYTTSTIKENNSEGKQFDFSLLGFWTDEPLGRHMGLFSIYIVTSTPNVPC